MMFQDKTWKCITSNNGYGSNLKQPFTILKSPYFEINISMTRWTEYIPPIPTNNVLFYYVKFYYQYLMYACALCFKETCEISLCIFTDSGIIAQI